MKNRRAYVAIFYFCFYIFSFLKSYLLWKYFVTQNVMINIFLPTHSPKTSDWRFAWQNKYGRRPLVKIEDERRLIQINFKMTYFLH